MPWTARSALAACVLATGLAGCATRLEQVRIEHVDPSAGYRVRTELERVVRNYPDTLLLLAFSGGGTRAAAFSYGVLEELRGTVVVRGGRKTRMLDHVDAISSVSGGSFTALAYGLLGERLFSEFEPRFLKRDVQQALLNDVLNPINWPGMMFGGFSRSDLAADYYDAILFNGATFGDLAGKPGPLIMASSTEFATGYRFLFVQDIFDLLCADLSSTRLALAATASSAVPVAFAPVTLTNWGGSCGMQLPQWARQAAEDSTASTLSLNQRVKQLRELGDSTKRPWLHLVDGGVSDNLGLRAFMDLLELLQLRDDFRLLLASGHVRRVAVIVVNSLSNPPVGWDRSPAGPSIIEAILQSTSVPIDHNSMDEIVLMESMIERWWLQDELRTLRSRRLPGQPAPGPDIEFYPIVLDFAGISDAADREFFLGLPTTLALPDQTIDRLRAVGGSLLRESPQFQHLLRALAEPEPNRPSADVHDAASP